VAEPADGLTNRASRRTEKLPEGRATTVMCHLPHSALQFAAPDQDFVILLCYPSSSSGPTRSLSVFVHGTETWRSAATLNSTLPELSRARWYEAPEQWSLHGTLRVRELRHVADHPAA